MKNLAVLVKRQQKAEINNLIPTRAKNNLATFGMAIGYKHRRQVRTNHFKIVKHYMLDYNLMIVILRTPGLFLLVTRWNVERINNLDCFLIKYSITNDKFNNN